MKVEKIGSATLYLGDCREIAPTLQGVQAVISDPPYGMDWNTDSKRFTGGNRDVRTGQGRDDYEEIAGDAEPFDPLPWLAYQKVVLWGSNHYASKLPKGTTLVWIKKADHLFGTFLSDCEIGWMKGGHGVYAHRKQFPPPARMAENFGSTAHPTQKPISLMTWSMQRAKVSGLVLDPFMGSGTTGLACLQLGLPFVGIELQPKYFDTACERIAVAHSQGRLFA